MLRTARTWASVLCAVAALSALLRAQGGARLFDPAAWSPAPLITLPDHLLITGRLAPRAFTPFVLSDIDAPSGDRTLSVNDGAGKSISLKASVCLKRLNDAERTLARLGHSLRDDRGTEVPLYDLNGGGLAGQDAVARARLVSRPKTKGFAIGWLRGHHDKVAKDAKRTNQFKSWSRGAGTAASVAPVTVPFEIERGNHDYFQAFIRGSITAGHTGGTTTAATTARLGGSFFGRTSDLIVLDVNGSGTSTQALTGRIRISFLGHQVVDRPVSSNKPVMVSDSVTVATKGFDLGSLRIPAIGIDIAFRLIQEAKLGYALALRPGSVDGKVEADVHTRLYAEVDIGQFFGLGKIVVRLDGDLVTGHVEAGVLAEVEPSRSRPGSLAFRVQRHAYAHAKILAGTMKVKACFKKLIFFGSTKCKTLFDIFKFDGLNLKGFLVSDDKTVHLPATPQP